jgi:hypothetical protein
LVGHAIGLRGEVLGKRNCHKRTRYNNNYNRKRSLHKRHATNAYKVLVGNLKERGYLKAIQSN